MEHIFRIFDFNVYNSKDSSSSDSSDEDYTGYKDSDCFNIQIFGVDENGKTCSIIAEDYRPFFYVMVNDNWTIQMKDSFVQHIKEKIGKYYKDSILDCKIIKRKKLYGFDGGKEHKFIKFEFMNMNSFNKTKNLWYTDYSKGHQLLKDGYNYLNTNIKLYEANIPPLLRFFHIKDISPSGWIALPTKKTIQINGENKKTSCDCEFKINYKHIIPLNDKEVRVPYKIMSFDIEASSSHGDFPVPVKSYKKLAINIVDYFNNLKMELTNELCKNILKRIILAAFGHENMNNIDLVYPKVKSLSKESVNKMIELWLETPITNFEKPKLSNDSCNIEELFEKMAAAEEDDENDDNNYKKYNEIKLDKKSTIVDLICDKKFSREDKIKEIYETMFKKERKNNIFPELEGDKVTFIGSTFMKYGDTDPYMNHCIVLNTCSELPLNNSFVESYNNEKDVLIAWQKLVQRENPDIVIGYNIFGFDYMFMFKRAEENNCIEEFLKLSRNKEEICAEKDRDTGKYKMEESSIQIASGQHDLRFIKMNGRLQVDLYNFYRREANLISYKLDYVAGNFIGDYVKEISDDTCITTIKTKNLTGLLVGSYVHFEEISHSVDYYGDGAKFLVTYIDKEACKFKIEGVVKPDMTKKVRWCLAKDDVTPKDIFRMTNGTADDRSVIAKYCIQDCNLVHYLFNKSDILTGFIEMAKICSVPINFLVMRGQGIKLTSYIAKKCREKRTLMPVIEKGGLDEGYEGAIVLDPKCDLYLDNPVACVDYASLYPSSMISENLSHDSKVWTREYDLAGELIEDWGEKDEKGNYLYDNLPGYEYVDIEYDTYRYYRKNPKAAAEKIKSGYKICRFAQPNHKGEGEAIMPSILKELLKARKDTRKLIPLQPDEFMKQVLDQRQLGYKVTANSLYGQCGAKTSTFYEKDIAACTTSTGRKLLTYAKRIIEECYGDKICNTANYGPVLTKAEYIYGDSVANYTPVYVSTIKKDDQSRIIDIVTIEQLAEKYGNNRWVQCLEEGKQEKEVCELEGVESWTEKGWTKLYRVIRHKLASHKKMIRVLTNSGLVDVTDDHSLILKSGKEISPKNINIGTELLHNKLPINNYNKDFKDTISEDEAQIMGFFFGNGNYNNLPNYKQYEWTMKSRNLETAYKYLYLCKKVYPQFNWTIVMHTKENNGMHKIILNCNENEKENMSRFIKNYGEKMYYNNCKIIPSEIINSSENIRFSFFIGLCDANNEKDLNYTKFHKKNQITASYICWLGSNLGYSVTLNNKKENSECYRIKMTKLKQKKNSNMIKDFYEIPYEGYVYDLTTENHHFAAGIGKIIVHNTDSVFFTFNLQTPDGKPIRGKEALEITIELAQEAGHLASSFLKGPHDLEYEKTFMPFCLLSKKRYVGMLYETDPNSCKRKEMGIVLKRRDNAPIVKDIYGGIIDILMKKQDIKQAIDYLKNCLQNIVEEKYPIEKLIITKSLRSGYKNPQSIAHKVLADRITERDPGNKPSSGDRIPFVYISTQNKKALQGDKIETPTYIRENNIKIDYSFYITNQIMKPVQQVFALVLEKIWEMQGKNLTKGKKFKKEVEILKNSCEKDKFDEKLEQLKNKEVKSLLFDEYLRITNNEKEGVQSITKFFGNLK
jgi:DNA polymerase elongation subunit (family B)